MCHKGFVDFTSSHAAPFPLAFPGTRSSILIDHHDAEGGFQTKVSKTRGTLTGAAPASPTPTNVFFRCLLRTHPQPRKSNERTAGLAG